MSVAEISSVNLNTTLDGTFNLTYTGQAPMEAVADFGEGMQFWVNQGSINNYGYGPFNAMPRSVRTVCNGDRFGFYLASVAGFHDFSLKINRVPVSTAPFVGSAAGWHSIYFKNAKSRLIDIRTSQGIGGLYTSKPYELFKPPNRLGPRVLIMGDSWTSAANVTASLNACYWDFGAGIGSEDVWVDYFGGTGYTVTNAGDGSGTTNRYIDRLNNPVLSGQTWDIAAINPKVVIVHGGGANDKFKGKTNQQVIDGVIAVFQSLRTKLPKAKLIYMEGFAPPGFTPATYNPNYIAIRTAVQAALTATGVYYVDVATTLPWVRGAGTVAAPNADLLNSSKFISSDGFHEVDEGGLYRRDRTARVVRKIMADRGPLLNTLVA